LGQAPERRRDAVPGRTLQERMPAWEPQAQVARLTAAEEQSGLVAVLLELLQESGQRARLVPQALRLPEHRQRAKWANESSRSVWEAG